LSIRVVPRVANTRAFLADRLFFYGDNTPVSNVLMTALVILVRILDSYGSISPSLGTISMPCQYRVFKV
jgi:hypothetical protein